MSRLAVRERALAAAAAGARQILAVGLASTPSTRPRRPARALWLVPILLLGLVLSPFPGPIAGSPAAGLASLSWQQEILLGFTLLGLLRMAYDPRPALGCGLVGAMYAADRPGGRPRPAVARPGRAS
jgi:hypothetical protein